jgi:hypothetical protein
VCGVELEDFEVGGEEGYGGRQEGRGGREEVRKRRGAVEVCVGREEGQEEERGLIAVCSISRDPN